MIAEPLFVNFKGVGFYSLSLIESFDKRPFKTEQLIRIDQGYEEFDQWLNDEDQVPLTDENSIEHCDSVWSISLFNIFDDKKAFPQVQHFLKQPVHQEFVKACDPYFQGEPNHEKLKKIIIDMLDKAMVHAEAWLELNGKFTYYRMPNFLNLICMDGFPSVLVFLNDIDFVNLVKKRVETYLRFLKGNGGFGVKTAMTMLGLNDWKELCQTAIEFMPEYQKIRKYLHENPDSVKRTIYQKSGVDGNQLRYTLKTAIQFNQFIVTQNSKGREVINLVR